MVSSARLARAVAVPRPDSDGIDRGTVFFLKTAHRPVPVIRGWHRLRIITTNKIFFAAFRASSNSSAMHDGVVKSGATTSLIFLERILQQFNLVSEWLVAKRSQTSPAVVCSPRDDSHHYKIKLLQDALEKYETRVHRSLRRRRSIRG